jgi:hypothetical protein
MIDNKIDQLTVRLVGMNNPKKFFPDSYYPFKTVKRLTMKMNSSRWEQIDPKNFDQLEVIRYQFGGTYFPDKEI